MSPFLRPRGFDAAFISSSKVKTTRFDALSVQQFDLSMGRSFEQVCTWHFLRHMVNGMNAY
jgi:hypothetical protein